MEIRGSSQTAAAWAGEAIALGFFESETVLTVPENLTALDERLSG